MSCSGTPDVCSTWNGDQGTCEGCGCTYVVLTGACKFTADACNTHAGEVWCNACGCDWSVSLNMQINIGDVWKDVAAVQINVGDSWKTVTSIQINIGDSWKTVF